MSDPLQLFRSKDPGRRAEASAGNSRACDVTGQSGGSTTAFLAFSDFVVFVAGLFRLKDGVSFATLPLPRCTFTTRGFLALEVPDVIGLAFLLRFVATAFFFAEEDDAMIGTKVVYCGMV